MITSENRGQNRYVHRHDLAWSCVSAVIGLVLSWMAVPAMGQTKEAFDAFERGNTLLEAGKYDQAESQFRIALAISSDFVSARNNLGIALYKQDRLDEALAEFQKAAKGGGVHKAGADLNIGATLAAKHELDAGLAKSEEASKARNQYAESYYNIGWIQDARGKLAEAEAAYWAALRLRPQYVKAEVGLGIVLGRQERLKDALDIFWNVLQRKNLTGDERSLVAANFLAVRIFAMLHNPTPKDGSVKDATEDIVLSWGLPLPNDYPPLRVRFRVRLALDEKDLASQAGIEVAGNQYRPKKLEPNHKYFWQVVAQTEDGRTAASPVLSFLYQKNRLPIVPSNVISLKTAENMPVDLNLTASDPDNDQLTFKITKLPTHGKLTGIAPHFVYTPNKNFAGEDELQYAADDGQDTSHACVMRIAVMPELRPVDLSVVAREAVPTLLELRAINPAGRLLKYSVVKQPGHGTLRGEPPRLVYIADKGFGGCDALEFVVSFGSFTSASATVTIQVAANRVPVADGQKLTVTQYGKLNIILSGSDADGDPLAFRVTKEPSVNKCTGLPPVMTYDARQAGEDKICFVTNDGGADSVPETIDIRVVPYFVAHFPTLVMLVLFGGLWYMGLLTWAVLSKHKWDAIVIGCSVIMLTAAVFLEDSTVRVWSLLAVNGIILCALSGRALLATGKKNTQYRCIRCKAVLESPMSKIGQEDKCPICGQVCIVPRQV